MIFLPLIQNVNIEEKLKNAPDSGYQTGIIIGTFLPFLFFIALAYWMYFKAKNRNNNNNI